MGRIIVFANQKGGVGKTTSTVNIGAGLAQLGQRVLLVDLDPQASLTYSLGFAAHQLPKTVYHVLMKKETIMATLLPVQDRLQLLPANIELSAIETEIPAVPERELLLKEQLPLLSEFDYVLIDCPPSMGLLTLIALAAAREVIVPLQAEYLALQGVERLEKIIAIVKQRFNPSLHISGVIMTRFDRRKSLHREVLAAVTQHFGSRLLQPFVRDNIALAEAPSFGKHIFSYRSQSTGAKDYRELCGKICERSVLYEQ